MGWDWPVIPPSVSRVLPKFLARTRNFLTLFWRFPVLISTGTPNILRNMFVIFRSFIRRITGQCCDVVVTASFPFLWVPPNGIVLLHSVPNYRSAWCCLQHYILSYLIPSVHSDYMCISLDGAWLRNLIQHFWNLLYSHYSCIGCVGSVCCLMSLTARHFGNGIAQISSFFWRNRVS
jgi:hypothetical protein